MIDGQLAQNWSALQAGQSVVVTENPSLRAVFTPAGAPPFRDDSTVRSHLISRSRPSSIHGSNNEPLHDRPLDQANVMKPQHG